MNILPMQILSTKKYEENNIGVKSSSYRRFPNPDIDKRIEENWINFKKWANENGVPDHDSTYARINDIKFNGKITFNTGITSFKERIGILPSADFHMKYGLEAKRYLPNIFTGGTIALFENKKSKEKIIPIELREAESNLTALDYVIKFKDMQPPIYNTVAGFFNIDKDKSDSRIGIRRKLSMELNIPDISSSLKRNVLLGVIYDPNLDETYCCFKSELNSLWQDVKQTLSKEKRKFYFELANEKDAILNFIKHPPQGYQILEYTVVNLLLHAEDEWEGDLLEKFGYSRVNV